MSCLGGNCATRSGDGAPLAKELSGLATQQDRSLAQLKPFPRV